MITAPGAAAPVARPTAAPGQIRAAAPTEAVAASKVASSSDGDAVTLSTPPALIAAQGAPIDAAKIAAIRAQIANGTFRVDPRAIAAKMIAQDLPAK